MKRRVMRWKRTGREEHVNVLYRIRAMPLKHSLIEPIQINYKQYYIVEGLLDVSSKTYLPEPSMPNLLQVKQTVAIEIR